MSKSGRTERRIRLGRYTELSLADARGAALDAKARIAKDETPAVRLGGHDSLTSSS
jgi:hypothetical protein